MLAYNQKDPAERLRVVESNLINLLESTSDAFISVDCDWRYTYMNRAAEEIERISREEVLGKKMWEVFPNLLKAPFFKKYQQAMATNQPIEFEEFIDNKWNEIRVFPQPNGLAIYYRDITDRKEQERQVEEFIRMTSHELQTPLTSLRLYHNLLSKSVSGKNSKQYAVKVAEQISNLEQLIGALIEFSQVQDGKLPLKIQMIDLYELLAECGSRLQKMLSGHQLEIRAPANPIFIAGDRERLAQVFRNLVHNAAKYSPINSKIMVTLAATASAASFSVTDKGVGIAPAFHRDIFRGFYQLNHDQGYTFPGLGLGLYIAQLIVLKHGGTITVESNIGQGATFTVSLPRENYAQEENPSC